jgi:hypothetical protein
MEIGRKYFSVAAMCLCLSGAPAKSQKMPDVRCQVEDFPIDVLVSWQFQETLDKVQVVVLRDPAGEQEARFDLTHGATLVSLRYRGKELLYAHGAGACVAMFAPPPGTTSAGDPGGGRARLRFNPGQCEASMGVPATVAGVACRGQQSMRAFAMMIDRNANNSFQREPLLGVWMGYVGSNFPVGYSTPYTIETNASWVENPGKEPRWYLRLDQSVVNIRPDDSGPLDWSLEGASPWDFEHAASYPEQCKEKTPCTSASTRSLATGRYEDPARSIGFATVVPTAAWQTDKAYVRENAEAIALRDAPRHTFSTVLSRNLKGTSGFRFSWYVCAGSWERARAFADEAGRRQAEK